MPYYLVDDQWGRHPSWDVLSGGRKALKSSLQASFMRIATAVSGLKVDGYCTAEMARQEADSPRVLELLATRVLDEWVWLHRPGDECECLGTKPWVKGYAYRIHNFLKRNPSRKEYDLQRAKAADRKNAALNKLVDDRDGRCCRYCRSGPLSSKAGRSLDRRRVLTHDHVDPDRAASEDGGNYVVACDRCNKHKGERTPEEAEMVLLDPPTPEEAAQLAAREQTLFDLPTHRQEQAPINAESATERRSNVDPGSDRPPDVVADPAGEPQDGSAGELRPEDGTTRIQSTPDAASEVALLGRGGQPRPVPGLPSPDTPRDSLHPDPYTKRSRTPPAQPDPPPGAPP